MVKNTTTLTFYGGVNEIGGNKILLQERERAIFFDFGMSFSMKKQFYSPPFLSPRSERSLQELGILPQIKLASTSSIKAHLKLTPFSFRTAPWIIALIYHS